MRIPLLCCLLPAVAFADSFAPREDWTATSPDGKVTLRLELAAKLPNDELAADKVVLAGFAKRLKRPKPTSRDIVGPPLTEDEKKVQSKLAMRVSRGRGPRLTLTSAGKQLWSVDAASLPIGRGLVADDGRRVVLVEDSPGKDLGQTVLALLGDEGELVRAYDLEGLVPGDARDGLTRSVSHVMWLEDLALNFDRGEVRVTITQRGQAPPIYQAPKPLVRTLSLTSGLFLD